MSYSTVLPLAVALERSGLTEDELFAQRWPVQTFTRISDSG
jgi:hypothetical protein